MKNKIPKGCYCYGNYGVGTCPYWRKHEFAKMQYNTDKYYSVVICDYLKTDTYKLDQKNPFSAWLLYDMCKLCGENEGGDYDDN